MSFLPFPLKAAEVLLELLLLLLPSNGWIGPGPNSSAGIIHEKNDPNHQKVRYSC